MCIKAGPPLQGLRELEKGLASAVPTVSLAAAQRRIEALEQALELETKRRHEEELRALLEGAPFVLHRGSDRTLRHVWVADVPEKAGAMLRWQSNKGMTWSRGRAHRANLAKLPYHEAAVSLLTSVTYGAAAASGLLCDCGHRRVAHVRVALLISMATGGAAWVARPGRI